MRLSLNRWMACVALIALAACEPGAPAEDDAMGVPDGRADAGGDAPGGTGSDAAAVDGSGLVDALGGDTTVRVTPTLVDEASIGPDGGTLRADDNTVTVQIPAGAIADVTTLRLVQLAPADDQIFKVAPTTVQVQGDPWVVRTRRYRLEPAGLELAVPAWVNIHVPASDVPLPATTYDLGIYRRDDGGDWQVIDLDPPNTILKYYPNELSRSGTLTRFGEVAARLNPPYENAPQLVQIGMTEAMSTVDGPVAAIDPHGLLSIWGQGFGWDPSVVEVQVGGTVFPTQSAKNSLMTFWLSINGLTKDEELPVTVRVNGQPSNTLTLRVLGAKAGKSLLTDVQPQGGTCLGCKVRLQGTFYGLESTRRVLVGDANVAPETDDFGQLWVAIPPELSPGSTTIRVIDGLGGEPSDPWPYIVWEAKAPTLGLGLEAGGVWLPPTYPDPADDASKPAISLMLTAQNIPPYLSDWGSVEVRFASEATDTGWQTVPHTKANADACAALPSGGCTLTLPNAVVAGLGAGDTFTVQVRYTENVMPDTVPPDALQVPLTLESAPLTVQIAGRATLGAVAYANVGQGGGSTTGPCGVDMQPFNRGDVVCFMAAAACGPTCADLQDVSVPGLWDGIVTFSTGSGSDPRGARVRCVPLQTPGTYPLTNAGQGTTCSIEVVATGGMLRAYDVDIGDGSAGITVGAGGSRLELPPAALPPLPEGESYTVRWDPPLPSDTDNPALQTADPQVAMELGSYRLQVLPEPKELLKPAKLELPVAPSAGEAPTMGLIDTASAFMHALESTYDDVTGRLTAEIPAGVYATPTGKPKPGDKAIAIPTSFNAALGHIGVAYHKDKPGVLEDEFGHFRVSYVVDSTSADYVDELYASTALDAAVHAWSVLAGLSWKEPKGPISLSIRKSVSWASSTSKGATTSGFLGQPAITIKSDLADDEEIHSVVAHEVGHLFQRQYTTNLTLSWFDEGMAEWAAYKAVGVDFDTGGMTGDQDAVRDVIAGLPDSFGGVDDDYVYGVAAWTLWLAHRYGDYAMRKAYELLDWTPAFWSSAHATLAAATSVSIGVLMKTFAEDFWLQTYPPIDELSWTASLQAMGVKERLTLDTGSGVILPLPARPPASSQRWRLVVSTTDADAVNVGSTVLRAAGLGSGAEISVWHSSTHKVDPVGAVLVTRLDDVKPVVVLDSLESGVYWVLHNRWATSGTGAGSFSVELPRIKSVLPVSATAGEGVQVTGLHFGGKAGQLIVGGQQVQPAPWSDTAMQFTMPDFPNTSAVTVRIVTTDGAKTNEVTLQVKH